MPRSSTTQLSQDTINQLENQFFNFINTLSYDEKKQFFSEFLTNEEKMMMYKRLALYWYLLEGTPLAKIQQLIGVTHDTTRVYNKKKNVLSGEFKTLLKRIESTISQDATPQQAPVEGPQMQEEQVSEMQPQMEEQPMQTEEHHEEVQMDQPQRQEATMEEVKDEPQQTVDSLIEEQHEEATDIMEHNMPHMESPTHSEPEMPKEDQPIMHSFEPQEHHEHDEHQHTTDMPSMEPSQTMDSSSTVEQLEQKHPESEENNEEEGKEKKKGWGKFFGF